MGILADKIGLICRHGRRTTKLNSQVTKLIPKFGTREYTPLAETLGHRAARVLAAALRAVSSPHLTPYNAYETHYRVEPWLICRIRALPSYRAPSPGADSSGASHARSSSNE